MPAPTMPAATKRFITLVLSLALIAATIFVYALLLKPAYAEINELRGALASKKAALEEQEVVVSEVKKLISQYQSGIQTLKENISSALPAIADYPTLTNQLSAITRTFGLVMISLDFTDLPSRQGLSQSNGLPELKTIQFKMQLKGSYPAFKSFLSALETNVRVMDLASFSVSVSGSDKNYTYDVVGNTYYQEL